MSRQRLSLQELRTLRVYRPRQSCAAPRFQNERWSAGMLLVGVGAYAQRSGVGLVHAVIRTWAQDCANMDFWAGLYAPQQHLGFEGQLAAMKLAELCEVFKHNALGRE